MVTKIVQLDFLAKDEHERKRREKEEFEHIMKKTVRALFHRIHDMEDQILSQQKYIDMMREHLAAQ